MVKEIFRRSKRTLLVLSIVALSPATVSVAELVSDQATLGKQALQKQDYDRARNEFETGLRSAREAGDVDAEARFLFYRALTEQAEGEATGDEAALTRAGTDYKAVLALKPDSGSTMVNLAQIYDRLGSTELADRLYQHAISLDDERRTAYMMSYAEYLEASERNDEAVEVYRRVLSEEPQNAAAQAALSDYYLAPEREWGELEEHLWRLVRSGKADRAIEGALESLGDRTGDGERESLLTVIAAGLSRRFVAPEAFIEASWTDHLWGFREDPAIGDGIQQLGSVYATLLEDGSDKWQEGNPYDGMDFSWWQRGDRHHDPEVGLYPRDAFRLLMRSLGDRYAQRKERWIAEDCYKTAATFAPDELDPAAVRDLVNLYGRHGEVEEIENLTKEFEFRLFEGKGEAYRGSHLEKIYQYHQTLGQIYGYLAEKSGDWGSSTKPNSAIFQLERAYSVGQRLDRMADPSLGAITHFSLRHKGHEYHVDPGLVQRLAAAYEATGKKSQADEVRLQAAERYESVGDERAKTFVLRPVEATALAPVQKQRYEVLVAPKVQLESQPQIKRRIESRTGSSVQQRDQDDG